MTSGSPPGRGRWVTTTVSTTSTFSHTFPRARTFNLTLTVTDGGGLTNSVTHSIAVP